MSFINRIFKDVGNEVIRSMKSKESEQHYVQQYEQTNDLYWYELEPYYTLARIELDYFESIIEEVSGAELISAFKEFEQSYLIYESFRRGKVLQEPEYDVLQDIIDLKRSYEAYKAIVD